MKNGFRSSDVLALKKAEVDGQSRVLIRVRGIDKDIWCFHDELGNLQSEPHLVTHGQHGEGLCVSAALKKNIRRVVYDVLTNKNHHLNRPLPPLETGQELDPKPRTIRECWRGTYRHPDQGRL